MLYLILFYWIFAALFYYGVVYEAAKEESKSMPSVFMGCLLIGGIIFPIYIGRTFYKYLY
jgi:hypothetical protein